MKIWGIIFIIAGIGGIIQFVASAGQTASSIGFSIGFLVLGIYLIHRANQKKKDLNDKEKWEQGK